MTVSTEQKSFVGPQKDLQLAVTELAQLSHLKVKVTVEQPQMFELSLYEEQRVRFDITDIAPKDTTAPTKVRLIYFCNGLVNGLHNAGKEHNFKVELVSRDGTLRTFRLDEPPLTGVDVFKEYQKSLELPSQFRSSVVLRFISVESRFFPSSVQSKKHRTSDFI